MRVVAGTARSILLEAPEGRDTRPTTDRIKETLFNIIQGYTNDASVLDLFAGSGALGIEALSRGAEKAWFVDNAKEPIRCINGNVKRAGFADRSEILQCDFQSAIGRFKLKGVSFDLVFIDPPYLKGLETASIKALLDAGVLNDGCLLVVEESSEHDPTELFGLGLETVKIKKYKTNQHYFLKYNKD
ncbi:MAG: 16S rRNA (guanine(966)-N(2))-methyltransferase RsmD [Lachnospiraceae bacterium]|nr:16S rRNA (guanine(966)-N(2))-methyltransferase RsmD [Lachnospiraceae bacterium]